MLTSIISGCTLNNVEEDAAPAPIFKQHNLKGSFAMLDNIHEVFTVYNLKSYRDSAVAPGSSFQVLSTLLGIETGRYLNEKALVHYQAGDSAAVISLKDGFEQGNAAAMAAVAERIGADTLQMWIDSLHYGKKVAVSQDSAGYIWNNGRLAITPDEQLGFIGQLYFVKLPFQKRTQQIMRKLMIREDNTQYTLAYKAGWDHLTDGTYTGWVVGWVEENKHVYFFVLNAQPENGTPTEGSLVAATKEVLKHYGFFEGKK